MWRERIFAARVRQLYPVVADIFASQHRGFGSAAQKEKGPISSKIKEKISNKSSAARARLATVGASFAGVWLGFELLQNQQGVLCSGPAPAAGSVRPDLPTYSKEEVAKHRTKETGIWVTYRDGVYDVTEWADVHPGGSQRLMLAAGGPIDPFWAMYAQHNTAQVKEILEEYRIGNLEGGSVPVGNPYENEPVDRHPSLSVRSTAPMNAETPLSLLADSLVTPTELFYIRNHLPVPDIDESSYELHVGGNGVQNITLSLHDLKTKFKKRTVVATVQCAGNRRKDMMECMFEFIDVVMFRQRCGHC